MKIDGSALKASQKRYRLTDVEVCAEAGISIGTLRRVYENNPRVTVESINKVRTALETCRQKFSQALKTSVSS